MGRAETFPIGIACALGVGLRERSPSGSDDVTDLALCSKSARSRLALRYSFSRFLFVLVDAFEGVGDNSLLGEKFCRARRSAYARSRELPALWWDPALCVRLGAGGRRRA